jgi:PAS domain S-box-containing protein
MLKAITTRLQTKLTLAFVLVMLVPVAVIVVYNIITYRDSLIDNITQGEIDRIQTQADRVGQSLESVRGNTLFLSDDPAVSRYLNILTNQTVDPGALNFVQGLFTAFISNNPIAIKDVRILDVRGQEVVRVDNTDGTPEVITGAELENKADRPYFINAINLPDGEIYISGFDLNQTLSEYDIPYVPVIRYSTPLFTTNGTLAGVLVVKIFAEPLLAPLVGDGSGEITYIVDADGSYLLHPNPEVLYGSILGTDSRFINDQPNDATLMSVQASGYILGSQYQPDRLQTFVRVRPANQPTIDWLVIHAQPLQNIYNSINTPLIVQVVISLIATVLAITAAFFIARTIVTPLRQLSSAAQAIGAGEKNVNIPTVNSDDEIGDLARAFNTMSQELGAIYESLEDRIASRTADLETSAEISSAANQVREVDDLLSLAANLIRDRFDFYYVQVYLVQGDQAVLREGTGYVGRRLINRGHSLPLDGRSLVATTINTGKPQVVQDTKSDPNFLPNDLLPETRAEITIPLRTKTDIVGVLDIQHNKANAFDESAQRLFQSMADQLAVTFENVNLFESTQRRAVQMQTVAEVSAAAASNLNTEELLKQVSDLTKERFQLYHAHIYLYDEDAHSLVLTAGAGEAGRIMKERGHSIPFDLERSLVARAARTRKGVIVNNVTTEVGFLANPLLPNTKSELAIPMIVNNELIGVLDIQSDQLNRFDDEDLNVQNALAGQIAVAINNARAFEQTRQQEQRFRSLVTNIPNTIYRCLYDENWTMLFLSDSIEQLTGYPPAALVNNHVLSYNSLIHPDDVPMVEAAVREGVNNRASYVITYRITRADKSIRWVEERGQASFNEKGSVEWLDGAFVDITERRADEEERSVLGEISNRLVSASNQNEILAAFQVYGELIQADSTSLLYIDSNIDGEAEWGTVVAEWSKDGTATGLLNVPLKLSDFAIAKLWMSDPNTPFFIENIETDFRVDEPTREIYNLTGSKASVILPLNLQGRWIGLIVYNWKNPLKLTESQRSIFIGIMQRATLAIDAARASEAIIIAQEEAELLYVVSREINSAENEQDLVEVLVRHIAHEDALRVSLILWDTLDYDTASMVNIVATWNRGASVAPANVPINSIPFFSVLNRYDIAYSNDVPNDPRIDAVTRETLENLGYVAFILVPLTIGERWLGSLNILTDKPHIHTERQIRLLRGAAEQLTTAVQRLLSLRQAERRAAELATVARVSATTTTLLDVESLLVAVSELTKENFHLYHAHVYLLDESGETLMLAAGAGEAGYIMKIAEHSIPFNREQSLVARAARTQQGIIVNDVTQSENFLPNPLLPDTKSELAVPLRVGTDLLGVLDVQSDEINRFSEEDVKIQTALADQIAVAINNARAFEQVQLEISERRKVEEERSILSEISNMLVAANTRDDLVAAFKFYGDIIHVHTTFLLYIDIDAQGTPEWITIVAEASADGSPSGLLNVPLRLADFGIAKLWMADPSNALLIEDTTNDPRVDLPTQQIYHQISTQASVILPLNLQGRWIGLITYNWKNTVRFNELQQRIFTGIMQRAALAIDNARSTEAIIAAREESELLYQVGKEINAARSEQELVEIIVKYFIHTDTTVVALSLWENLDFDSATAFTSAARWSRDGSPADARTLPISHFPFLPFIDRRGIEVCDDVTLNSKLDAATRDLFQSFNINSYVFAPLTIGQRWIGVMGMYSDKPYDHDERLPRMLRGVTEQLAASVERLANLRQAEKRAAELATVAEVSAAATSTLDVDALLTQVSTLTKERFGLYHVHIYLLDKAQESLALAAGSGEAGIMMREAGHAIPLDSQRSLVARAARLRKGVIANDVTQEPGFLPNPLLPDTQSELAVPMVIGANLIGVLDVQGDTTNRFTDEDVRIQTALADQIAVAVNNARAFEIVRTSQEALGEQRTFLQRVLDNAPSSIFVKDYEGRFVMANVAQASMFLSTVEDLIGKTDHEFNPNPDEVAAYLEADRRVMDTGEPLFIAEEPVTNSEGLTKWYQTTKVPLQSPDGTKQVLGIATDITERKEAALTIETAREESDLLYQISKEINAARNEEELVDVAVRYLVYPEATAASLVLWDELDFDKAKAVNVAARWTRDANFQRPMVVPLSRFPFVTLLDRHNIGVFDDIMSDARVDEIGRETLASLGYRAFIFAPLTVGERWVGNLGIYSDQPHKHSDRLVRLMRGVVEQLTSAVERLNVLRQAEKRASELATVARVSAATTTILEVDDLLRSVSELTKESFNLYHAHIYLINDAGDNLILAGGAGEAGQIMKEEGHAIPLKRVNSLVARAARSRKGVVSNDVTQEPDFLPNPLLPETKSELAIPMIIGNELLGVLDVQSDVTNRFSEEDIRIKATLADQIAVAVNNARIYEVERESAEHLREVDRLKSQFLANMSHELRTPLNSIIGYSEVLLDGVDGELPDEAIEDVEAIHDSGKHLLALINEILDMAKIDAGQLHLDRKPAEVARIVSEVLKVGQSLIKEKPLNVEVVEDTPVPTVMVDALRVRQILINLVGNAVKFTEQGTITISYGLLNEREAYIKVRDTGVGISEDNLKVVFERFRQVDGSSTRRAGGTGLGLSITQQLVQLHGGDIYAESEPGVGSIFWFTLPVIETPTEPAKEVSKVTTNGKH